MARTAAAVALALAVKVAHRSSETTLVHDLGELVAALDRRVPRLEREGEREIAVEARALRRAALKRIAELERTPSPIPRS